MTDSITQHQAVEIGEEEKLDTALSNPRTAYPRFTEEKCAPTDTFADTDRRSKNDGEEEILPQIPVSIGVKNTRFESIKFAGDDWRAHVGDVYNISYQESGRIFKDTGRRAGIQFSFGNHLMSGGKDSARRTRTLYVAKKKHTISLSLDHLGVYTSYARVQTSKVRQCLVQMAGRFQQLDKLFAAMFVHVIESRDHRDLVDLLLQIRLEIAKYQPNGSSTTGSDADDTYLGDLGHHFEDLLSSQIEELTPQRQERKNQLTSFRVTIGTVESLLQYLQDGLEIPYWGIVIDAFSTALANENTLGSAMASLQLITARNEVRRLRGELHCVLAELSTVDEGIDAILTGIDKRIGVLDDFTDNRVLDPYGPDNDAGTSLSLLAISQGQANEFAVAFPNEQSTRQLIILTAVIILALIGAFVPFVKGFAISWSDNEPGKKSDSDYWYNISSSIAVIMGNFAMVIPLIKGSWLSAPYIITWMWFAVGLGCAVMSIVIYPLCNPGWSSLLAFCATIAGFGATLSITMAVGNDEASDQTAAEITQTKGPKGRSSTPQHNDSGKAKFE